MPSQWAPVYQSVWTHRKTFELAALLGVNETYAAAHLIRLWTWAIDNAPDGDLSRLSERAIAYGAGWTQEVSLFVGALRKSGYLDDDGTIHDWAEYAGKILERRQSDAERKQRSRGLATDVHGTANGPSGPVRRREDKSTEDKRREENIRTSPQPPPPDALRAAEGERNSGRRSGRRRGEEPAAPPPEVTAPLTTDDELVWAEALAAAAADMSAANGDLLCSLQPVGRSADGGMQLRAPPGRGLERFRGTLARALLDAGDDQAAQLVIFEG